MVSESFDSALGASYQLVNRIGAGASGEVWLATDVRTNESVAAKLLRPEHSSDHEIVARFIAERSVLTTLRHPDIVAVRDLVVEGDRVAIVMDYIAGGALRDVLDREGTLAPEHAAGVAALVLDALTAAHEKGVLHRDVKPDNILLTENWRALEPGDVKLTDFGIARILGNQTRMTTGLLGTPEYMSPEVIATGDGGPAADVYSVGIMLYELLAGRTPFAGAGNGFTIAQRHITATPPAIPIPDELWQQVQALLDKNPDARPSASAAAAGLRRIGTRLAGILALERSANPDRFDSEGHNATVLRGASFLTAPSAPVVNDGPTEPAPDLGEAPHATIHRPMARPVITGSPETRAARVEAVAAKKPWWKGPKALAYGAGVLILIAAVAAYMFVKPVASSPTAKPTTAQAAVTATEQDHPTPTGLTIARNVTWNPQNNKATLTITYSAQNAALTGPFLEILPGAKTSSSTCPNVTWSSGSQQRNLPSVTGITAACGWSVSPGAIAAQGTQAVTADIELNLPASGGQSAVQDWLNAASQATTSAVSDSTITSTAYPVQRLQNVEVTTPTSTITQASLPITLVPVWPSGPDTLNPLLQTSTVGAPSSMLQAVAGGNSGVRFSDACSGALAISSDGLSVTTLTQTPSCIVDAQVGNFTNLASQPFAIVTRGE